MAKKRNSKTIDENSKPKKKKRTILGVTAKEAGIMAALLSVLAIIIFVSAGLPSLMESAKVRYFFDPWDGGSPFDVFEEKNEIFAYSTAMTAIEQEMGVRISEEPYTYLAVDLEGAEEDMRGALKNYFTFWGKKNGKKVLFANQEQLVEQGLMSEGNGTFTDGCLLRILTNDWSEDRNALEVQYFFHYGNFEGQGFCATVEKGEDGWKATNVGRGMTT